MRFGSTVVPGHAVSALDGRIWAGSSMDMHPIKPATDLHMPAAKKIRPRPKPGEVASTPPSADDLQRLADLRDERRLNLRQLILRAHRSLNRRIAEKLVERGYGSIKPTHITVYSNIDLEGTRVSALAERANMTVQGMGQLTAELEQLGYLRRDEDPVDRRAKVVTFSDAGWELMLASFEVLREIEAEIEARLEPGDLDALRRILQHMFTEN